MYAVITTGGKQYKVKEDDVLRVEKLDVKENAEITLDNVLLVFDDKDVVVGTPTVKGAKVTAKVLSQGRSKKVEVVKYKSKSRYYKKTGHRQHFTEIQITKIAK